MAGQSYDWKSWLECIDEVCNDSLVESAAYFFMAMVDTPDMLVGLDEAALPSYDTWPTDPLLAAFLRRCCRTANDAASAKRHRFLNPPPAPTVAAGSVSAVQGCSALSLVSDLSAGPKVDVHALLTAIGIKDAPSCMLVEMNIWVALSVETEAAKKANRIAFSFVDLTAKEMLPIWMPNEFVGGKPIMEELSFLEDDAQIGLSALALALKKTTSATRFFRCLAHWAAVFPRYGIAATACGHLDQPTVWSHMDTVFRVAVSEGGDPKAELVALMYDELVRRDWSVRAQRGDKVDIRVEAGEINKKILEVAWTRIQPILKAAAKTQSETRGTGLSPADSTSMSLLKKQEAASNQMQARVDRSLQSLQSQQLQLSARATALKSENGGKHGGKGAGKVTKPGKSDDLPRNHKQRKADKFFDKKRSESSTDKKPWEAWPRK
jgi:ABC-type transporter Mla MlaB component